MLDQRTLLDIAPLFHTRRTRFFIREALAAYEDCPEAWAWLDGLDRRLNAVGVDVSVREIGALESLRRGGDWIPAAQAVGVIRDLTAVAAA